MAQRALSKKALREQERIRQVLGGVSLLDTRDIIPLHQADEVLSCRCGYPVQLTDGGLYFCRACERTLEWDEVFPEEGV